MDNVVVEKSFSFALRIVRLHKHLREVKREFVLSKQLLRSGTSIGANISEAQQAQSRKDFVSKMSIALKECSETEYWLKLLTAAEYLNENESRSISDECVELGKLLTSIVRTSSNNLK